VTRRLPKNLPKATAREVSQAKKQLARVSLRLRKLGAKAKARRK
jgi:hypothetical protein